MAARASVNITYQIGVETTPGTAVPANKRLPGTSFSLSPDLRTKKFRSNSYKYDTLVQLHREMTKGTFEGPLSYPEIIYPLAGLIGGVVSTTSGASTWTFNPSSTGPDANVKNFTCEFGDSTAAMQAAYVQFNSLNITISDEEAMAKGDLFARKLTSTTLTASPTDIVQLPININEVDVFLDSTFAGIGGTKLTDPSRVEIAIAEKFLAKEVLNTAFQSFKETAEQAYSVSAKVTVENNAQTQAIYSAMVAAGLPTRYLRIKATGPAIGAATYLFQFDAAVKVEAAPISDASGIHSYEFNFTAIHDATMGRAYSFKVVNELPAL